MNNRGDARSEMMVGIFAIVVMAILALMSFKVADISLFSSKDGKAYYASFKNIAGLDEKTKVKVAGVDAGSVEDIELVEGRAKLTLRMYPGVAVYSDSVAIIKATGLLGDKYVEVVPGAMQPPLEDGADIPNVRELADIDELVRNLTEVSVDLGGFVAELNNDEFKESLRVTINNLRSITDDLKYTVSTNKENLNVIIARIKSLAINLDEVVKANKEPFTKTMANLEDITGRVKDDTPQLLADLRGAAAELRRVMDESGPKIDDAVANVASIANKIDKGEGTIGRLVNDNELYDSVTKAAKGLEKTLASVDRFKTFVTFRGEKIPDESDGKGYFNVTFQPREERYYILGVVTNPIGKVRTTITNVNGTWYYEDTVKDDMEFVAQFGHRFTDTALRIGLTENTFGVGADQYFMNNRIVLSMDAWDFNGAEYQATDPHLKIGADIFATKNIFISGGYDNPLNDYRSGAFIGAGVRFEDEDLKYLFGSLPLK